MLTLFAVADLNVFLGVALAVPFHERIDHALVGLVPVRDNV